MTTYTCPRCRTEYGYGRPRTPPLVLHCPQCAEDAYREERMLPPLDDIVDQWWAGLLADEDAATDAPRDIHHYGSDQ